MENESQKRQILSKAKTLRNSTEWNRVYISPDLTPKERAENKKLRDELKRRRNEGEANLIIRKGVITTRPPDQQTRGEGTSDPPQDA